VRGAVHDIRSGDLHAQAHGWETRCDHNDPQNFDRGKREDRDAARVFEDKADQERAGLRNVLQSVTAGQMRVPQPTDEE